jgi:hypothetical protein
LFTLNDTFMNSLYIYHRYPGLGACHSMGRVSLLWSFDYNSAVLSTVSTVITRLFQGEMHVIDLFTICCVIFVNQRETVLIIIIR